jgi:hypothetical protein
VVNFTPRPFYPRERNTLPILQRLCGPQGRSGRLRKPRPHRNSIPRTSSPPYPNSGRSLKPCGYVNGPLTGGNSVLAVHFCASLTCLNTVKNVLPVLDWKETVPAVRIGSSNNIKSVSLVWRSICSKMSYPSSFLAILSTHESPVGPFLHYLSS